MVKGTSHRVIVVKSPDERYFREAIFVIRDDVFQSKGVDSEAILKEALRAAKSYSGAGTVKKQKTSNRLLSKLPAPYFAAAGAAATGIAWLAMRLIGV